MKDPTSPQKLDPSPKAHTSLHQTGCKRNRTTLLGTLCMASLFATTLGWSEPPPGSSDAPKGSQPPEIFVLQKVNESSIKVYFDANKEEILPDSIPILDDFAGTLTQQEPNSFSVRIEGHADETADSDYNIGLSARRAQTVKDYLVKRTSLAPDLFATAFFGEDRPEVGGHSLEDLAKNRRVQVSVTLNKPATAATPGQTPRLLTMTPDGQWILFDDGSGGLVMQHMASKNTLVSIHPPEGTLNHLALSPLKGRFFLTVGSDRLLRIWDTSTGRLVNSLRSNQDAFNQVAISGRDPGKAVSVGQGGNIIQWDLIEGKVLRTFKGHEETILSISFLQNNRYFATGSVDGNIRTWDSANSSRMSDLDNLGAPVTALASGPEDMLVAGDRKGQLTIWDLREKKRMFQFPAHRGEILSLAVSPDGSQALSGGEDGAVHLWDVHHGTPILTLEREQKPVHSVAFHAIDPRIGLSASRGYGVHMWDLATGTQIRDFQINVLPQENNLPDYPAKPGETIIEPTLGIPFNWVPSGCFDMGCSTQTDSCASDAQPLHEVCMTGFWMSQYEVSQDLWYFITDGNLRTIDPARLRDPITKLDWEMTQEFIAALNTRTQKWFRLPTEAEWEYACRGGQNGNPFPSEPETPAERLERLGRSPGTTIPPGGIGSKPNGLGLVDMQGNVWEWVADVYNPTLYSSHSHFDPVHVGGDAFRFTGARYTRSQRGGSWDIGNELRAKCERRGYDLPGVRSSYLGLRLIMEPQR